MDIVFTELSTLYIESDDIQKTHIYNSIATTPSLHQLRDFISRTGKQIHSQADSTWLETGIAAAMIDGARADSQNLIQALVLFRFAAELSGIRAKSFFDKAIQNSDQKKVQILNVLKSVRDYKNAGIHHSVQTCGDAEWISKSIYEYGQVVFDGQGTEDGLFSSGRFLSLPGKIQ